MRTVPRAFRSGLFSPGTRNADIGGGRFDDATALMAALDVDNIVFDPFNRSAAHNRRAAALLRGGQAATATVLNVLNVIACPEARDRAVALAADALGPGGHAYFQVYEGNRSGRPGPTARGWQENRPLATYLDGIAVHFARVGVRGGVVLAAEPRPAPWAAAGRRWRTLEQASAAAAGLLQAAA